MLLYKFRIRFCYAIIRGTEYFSMIQKYFNESFNKITQLIILNQEQYSREREKLLCNARYKLKYPLTNEYIYYQEHYLKKYIMIMKLNLPTEIKLQIADYVFNTEYICPIKNNNYYYG